jgi:spore maturation protein CgeB
MNVFLVSNKNPNFPTITEFVEQALAALGHSVTFFDDRRHIFPGMLRARIPAFAAVDLTLTNQRLVAAAKKNPPDLILVLGGSRVFPETVSAIKSSGAMTVLWTVDAPVDFAPELGAAPRYDRVFCGGTEAIDILDKVGVVAQWLPFACDTQSYFPVSVSDEERSEWGGDVVFIGSYYPNRWEMLRQLTDVNLTIWGPGWEQSGCRESGRIRIRNAQLHFEQQRKIYAASKVALVIHYQDGKTPCYQASPKVYEALACGAFVLCDRQRDVFSLFKDRVHLAGFDNVDDLKAQLRYYLDHPVERRAIAEQGRREVLDRHDYKHRLGRLLDHVQDSAK